MLNKFKVFPFAYIIFASTLTFYVLIVWHISKFNFSGLGAVPVIFGIYAIVPDSIIVLALSKFDKVYKLKNATTLVYFLIVRIALLSSFLKPNDIYDIRNILTVMIASIVLVVAHFLVNL